MPTPGAFQGPGVRCFWESRGQYSLDDVRNVQSLIGLGATQARTDAKHVIAAFLQERAGHYEPCHRPPPIEHDAMVPTAVSSDADTV